MAKVAHTSIDDPAIYCPKCNCRFALYFMACTHHTETDRPRWLLQRECDFCPFCGTSLPVTRATTPQDADAC